MPTKVTLYVCAVLVLVVLADGCVALESTLRSWELVGPHISSLSTTDTGQPTATPTAPAGLSPVVRLERTASASGAEALLSLLRYVPDDYRNYVAYGDAAAWYRAWGVSRLTYYAELRSLGEMQAANLLTTFGLQTLMPNLMRFPESTDMRPVYGFNWFDLDRVLEVGRFSLRSITIAETGLPAAQIEAALLASGYVAEPWYGGSTLYSGNDGPLARIVVADGMLLLAWSTEHIEEMFAAHVQGRSLADEPTYLAAVTALGRPTLASRGALVGAVFMRYPASDASPANWPSENEAAQTQVQAYAERPLPPYDLTLFATHQAAGAAYLSLIVIFPPGTDTAAAAALLGERLQNYIRLRNQRPLADDWSLVAADAEEINQLPVAVVTLRILTPTIPVEPLILSWNSLIFTDDLLFLATDPASTP